MVATLELVAFLLKMRVGRGLSCPSAFGTQRSTATWTSTGYASEPRNHAVQAQAAAELQVENKQLRSKLAALRWPRLKSFSARGQVYLLPWHPHGSCLHVPTPAELRYLSGLFDGDGCVSTCGRNGEYCVLSMTQSYDHAEPLLKLQDVFGGGIYYHSGSGRGLQKPTLQWHAPRTGFDRVARQLQANSSTKRRQLELGMQWPGVASERRERALELRLLKQYDSAVDLDCCWAYCSGFFDAEGSIQVDGRGAVRVRFSQKFPTALENLQRFLAKEGLTAAMYEDRRAFELRIQRLPDSKFALRRMLQAGLQRKAFQAQLVLDMTPQTASQVREAFPHYVGNQQFGKRLDEAGLKRASRIGQLQQQARRRLRKGQQEGAANLAAEIDVLKCEHGFLKAQLENRELRDYICAVESLQRSGWQNFGLQERVG